MEKQLTVSLQPLQSLFSNHQSLDQTKHMHTCMEMASSALASGAPTARLVRSRIPGRLEASRARPPAALCLATIGAELDYTMNVTHLLPTSINYPGSCDKTLGPLTKHVLEREGEETSIKACEVQIGGLIPPSLIIT